MTSPKVVLRLAGGLGNQLFQFAASVRLAECQAIPFSNILIDTRFLASYESKQKYEIGFMTNLFPGVQVTSQIPVIESVISRFRLAKIVDAKLGSLQLLASIEHLNAACLSRNNVSAFIMDGYFQHPSTLFTNEDRNRIYDALIFEKGSLIDEVKSDSPTIGIHIRRGDYVSSAFASKVFRNIPIDYYDTALNQLRRNQKVLVFSDDRELSASYAAKIGGLDVRQLNLSLEDEFCLLMACDDHVIANSTFSWWAAYLGYNSSGRLIAPQNWYHDKDRSEANPLLLPHFELVDL